MIRLQVVARASVHKDLNPAFALEDALALTSQSLEKDAATPNKKYYYKPAINPSIKSEMISMDTRANGQSNDMEIINENKALISLESIVSEKQQQKKNSNTNERIEQLEEEIIRLRLSFEAEQAENARLRDELGRKTRDISALNVHVETLTQHLEACRTTDANSYLHTKKDSVIELEALKARASKAERERDALLFQLQEMERRSRMEREAEAAIREEISGKAAENERKAAYSELQRVRAEAEAGALRHQMEHWRSAARAAQDEVAGLRTELELGTYSEMGSSAKESIAKSVMKGSPLRPQQPNAIAATELFRRQQQVLQTSAEATSQGDSADQVIKASQQEAMKENAKQRLAQISTEIAKLEDEMDDIGPPAGRTLNQRLQREHLRKQIDELNREASKIRASISQ